MVFGYMVALNPIAFVNAFPSNVAQGLVWGVMALGLYITFRLLDFSDLTVDGSLATGGAMTVLLTTSGCNIWVALLVATLTGMTAGLCTGVLHTRLGIPPILSGILTQIALYSVNLRILGGSNMALSVDKYDLILSSRNPMAAIISGGIFCAALIGIMYWYFGTEQGSAIRATGCNPSMSKAQGINNDNMKLIALCLGNGLVALSGGLLSQFQGFADVNMGRGAIVIGLAAIIIGEVFCDAIFGKKANFAVKLSFVVVGAIMYYVVIGIVIWLRMNPNDLKLFTAVIVAIFLAVPNLRAKQKNSFKMAGRRSALALKATEKEEV